MKRTLKLEILFSVIGILFLYVLVTIIIDISRAKRLGEEQIETYREQRMLQSKEKLSGLVETALSVLKFYEAQVDSGFLDRKTAQRLAAQQVRKTRYGQGGYFWVDDKTYTLKVLPPDPSQEGKNREHTKDLKGKKFVKELVDQAVATGEAYVEYYFRKLNSETPSPKLGHTQLFEPWGWVIGTGFYIDDIEIEIEKQQEELEESASNAVWQKISTFIISTLIMFVVIGFVINYSLQPLNDLKQVIETGASGDLSQRVQSESKNDIAQVIGSFNLFMDKLENVINEIKAGAVVMNSIAQAINAANEVLAEKASMQANAVEETSSTLEEVEVTVNSSRENARETEKLAAVASNNAKKASEHSEHLTRSMYAIVESSEEITEMLEMLQDIAFQTHMLSLNAGIEASKAGEHGKGFVVVANEIRNLAASTTAAGKKIGKLIKNNTANLEVGNIEVDETINSLSEISNETNSISEKITEVAFSTEEQRNAVEQINRAMVEIDTAIQSNAQIAEETSAEASMLLDRAISFTEMVSFFKTRETNSEGKSLEL